MSLFGTAFSRAQAKRDACRKAQSDVEKRIVDRDAQIEAKRLAMRNAVAEGGGADSEKITSEIVQLQEAQKRDRELLDAHRFAVEAAEAGYAVAREKETVSRIEAAIATTQKAWLEARESVAPAALALAEARGRERQLADRLVKLYSADRKMGGNATVILNDKSLKDVGELAAEAMYAKHGERVNRAELQYHDRFFGYLIEGLAGPEPEIDPGKE